MVSDFSCITGWHYDEDAEAYTVYHYSVLFPSGEETLSPEKTGRKDTEALRVRVPTLTAFDGALGDYVFPGYSAESSPPKDECLRIRAIRDNRRFSVPHFRIDLS